MCGYVDAESCDVVENRKCRKKMELRCKKVTLGGDEVVVNMVQYYFIGYVYKEENQFGKES